MKKFLRLCLAVAALATMFGFASCSNGSSDDSTSTNATSTDTTTTTDTTTGTDSDDTTTTTDTTTETDSGDTTTTTDTTPDTDSTDTTTTTDTTLETKTVSDAAATLTIPTRSELTGKTFKKYDGGKVKDSYVFSEDTISATDKNGDTWTAYYSEDSGLLDDYTIRKVGDAYYMYDEDKMASREGSGTGLFTTWKNSKGTMTFNSDGTMTTSGKSPTGTFVNNSGVITAKLGKTITMLYDGTNIYETECKAE